MYVNLDLAIHSSCSRYVCLEVADFSVMFALGFCRANKVLCVRCVCGCGGCFVAVVSLVC